MKDDLIQQPIKLVITHENPDPDAIGAIWLFLKFGGPDFDGAQFYFVAAGNTIGQDTLAAKELHPEEVVHVDTGLGPFDHHQQGNTAYDSATMRVYDYLKERFPDLKNDHALKRMVTFINGTDHFESCYWPEATHDRYMFMFEEILKGLRSGRQFNDRELVEFGMICLDGVYISMRMLNSAEEDVQNLGWEFESKWGRALAIENKNDEVIKLAQKQGFQLVIRKDEEQGHIRIKAVPEKNIDLTSLYEKIMEKDTKGTWYLHPAKTMLLNGTKKSREHSPSPLTLKEIVEIVKTI